jgi:glycosyltransferase involved in cell wall biosynthesis
MGWSTPPWWLYVLPPKLRGLIQRRIYPEIERGKCISIPLYEGLRLLGSSSAGGKLSGKAKSLFDDKACNTYFDKKAAKFLSGIVDFKIVYGYFDTALHSFREAKRLGIRTVYELPTPHWQWVEELCLRERERLPLWSETMHSNDDFRLVAAQRDEELELADLVVVPSNLVKESLLKYKNISAKIEVVPYGCSDNAGGETGKLNCVSGKLKLLFVGRLSQTKGLADLLEACSTLQNEVTLTIAGEDQYGMSARFDSTFVKYEGQVSNSQVLELMREHDVFVLPTLFEGLSIAILEAMSAGMAVVTTKNSGLVGIVDSGREAILIDPGDVVQLRGSIESLLRRRDLVTELGGAAARWAAVHGWANYRRELGGALSRLIES